MARATGPDPRCPARSATSSSPATARATAAEFRYLDQLAPGDEVIFTTDTGAHTYLVTGTQIVTPNDLWITNPTDTPTATLFACHPLGSTAKRIVVNLALAT